MAAGGQMFNARWVDEQHKEKSRYVVKDFANTRGPTMFAAASDKAVGRVQGGASKLQHVHVRCDVGVHHAWEDELVFLEPPPEEIEECGDCMWRSVRVIYGRRKGARIVGRSISTPSSGARRPGKEVSRWNRIGSVRHCIMYVRRMA